MDQSNLAILLSDRLFVYYCVILQRISTSLEIPMPFDRLGKTVKFDDSEFILNPHKTY